MKKIMIALLLCFTITATVDAQNVSAAQYKKTTDSLGALNRLQDWRNKRDSVAAATLTIQMTSVAASIKDITSRLVAMEKPLVTEKNGFGYVIQTTSVDTIKYHTEWFTVPLAELTTKFGLLQSQYNGLITPGTGTIPKIEGRLTTAEGEVKKIPKSATSTSTTITTTTLQ